MVWGASTPQLCENGYAVLRCNASFPTEPLERFLWIHSKDCGTEWLGSWELVPYYNDHKSPISLFGGKTLSEDVSRPKCRDTDCSSALWTGSPPKSGPPQPPPPGSLDLGSFRPGRDLGGAPVQSAELRSISQRFGRDLPNLGRSRPKCRDTGCSP